MQGFFSFFFCEVRFILTWTQFKEEWMTMTQEFSLALKKVFTE